MCKEKDQVHWDSFLFHRGYLIKLKDYTMNTTEIAPKSLQSYLSSPQLNKLCPYPLLCNYTTIKNAYTNENTWEQPIEALSEEWFTLERELKIAKVSPNFRIDPLLKDFQMRYMLSIAFDLPFEVIRNMWSTLAKNDVVHRAYTYFPNDDALSLELTKFKTVPLQHQQQHITTLLFTQNIQHSYSVDLCMFICMTHQISQWTSDDARK